MVIQCILYKLQIVHRIDAINLDMAIKAFCQRGLRKERLSRH